jgi:hypothetical protein
VALSDCDDIGVLANFRLAANMTHAAAIALEVGGAIVGTAGAVRHCLSAL